MFDNLSEKLGGILDKLTGRGALSEKDVDAAMREVRRALLEADVSLDVVRSFIDRVREQAPECHPRLVDRFPGFAGIEAERTQDGSGRCRSPLRHCRRPTRQLPYMHSQELTLTEC